MIENKDIQPYTRRERRSHHCCKTAPADDNKELDKNQSMNKEEIESSGEEDENGSPNEINSKYKSTNNDEQQEPYFKTGP